MVDVVLDAAQRVADRANRDPRPTSFRLASQKLRDIFLNQQGLQSGVAALLVSPLTNEAARESTFAAEEVLEAARSAARAFAGANVVSTLHAQLLCGIVLEWTAWAWTIARERDSHPQTPVSWLDTLKGFVLMTTAAASQGTAGPELSDPESDSLPHQSMLDVAEGDGMVIERHDVSVEDQETTDVIPLGGSMIELLTRLIASDYALSDVDMIVLFEALAVLSGSSQSVFQLSGGVTACVCALNRALKLRENRDLEMGARLLCACAEVLSREAYDNPNFANALAAEAGGLLRNFFAELPRLLRPLTPSDLAGTVQSVWHKRAPVALAIGCTNLAYVSAAFATELRVHAHAFLATPTEAHFLSAWVAVTAHVRSTDTDTWKMLNTDRAASVALSVITEGLRALRGSGPGGTSSVNVFAVPSHALVQQSRHIMRIRAAVAVLNVLSHRSLLNRKSEAAQIIRSLQDLVDRFRPTIMQLQQFANENRLPAPPVPLKLLSDMTSVWNNTSRILVTLGALPNASSLHRASVPSAWLQFAQSQTEQGVKLVDENKRAALGERFVAAIKFVAPFIDTAFVAQWVDAPSRQEERRSFLQVYAHEFYLERLSRLLPPVFIDPVNDVRISVRLTRRPPPPNDVESTENLETEADARTLLLATSVVQHHASKLTAKYKHITGVMFSTMRRIQYGSSVREDVIAVYIFEKGVTPFGTQHLPTSLTATGHRNAEGLPVDVREGFFEHAIGAAHRDMVNFSMESLRPGSSISRASAANSPMFGPLSVGVYARRRPGDHDAEFGFVTVAHGFERGDTLTALEPNQGVVNLNLAADGNAISVVAPAVWDADANDGMGAAVGSARISDIIYRGYHSDGQTKPVAELGTDVAFVTTATDMQQLARIQHSKRDWQDIRDASGDADFPIIGKNDAPSCAVAIVGPWFPPEYSNDTLAGAKQLVPVIKSGRTTGLKRGGLRARRPCAVVRHFATIKPLLFADVFAIVSQPQDVFALPGDSGSCVCFLRGTAPDQLVAEAVGLVLGTFDGRVICLPIQRVQDALNVRVGIP